MTSACRPDSLGNSEQEQGNKPPSTIWEVPMGEIRPMVGSTLAAGHVLGRKLDSVPFSAYHVSIIAVLALVGFIEGYDLVMTGSLLVLAKEPLHLTDTDIRWLAVGPTFMLCIGRFPSSAGSGHWSPKATTPIRWVPTIFFTSLLPLAQSAPQPPSVGLPTALGAG